MSNLNCNCRPNCTVIAVIASIIIGIITAFLSITAVITLTPAFLWVLLGIAVVYLAIALGASILSGRTARSCVCSGLSAFLTGILGTVLTSVILLGITFAAASVIGSIITGALLFFFSLIITSAVCLIRCLTNCD
ncbi:MAG: hypothetical protein IKU47_01620 [Oscillospiraceae bacterium]|nr:hypothetical protein [Oscillospiraceae bacterium]